MLPNRLPCSDVFALRERLRSALSLPVTLIGDVMRVAGSALKGLQVLAPNFTEKQGRIDTKRMIPPGTCC